MSVLNPTPRARAFEFSGFLARALLGAVFIYMGFNKALHPVDFLKLIHEYQLVETPWLLNSIAAALPWFEVFCGTLLLAGVAVRGSALVVILMLVPFTAVVFFRAWNLAAAQGLSFWLVKFDCGCGNGEVVIWKKMLENIGMILVAGWLVTGQGRRFCARFTLLPFKRG